MCQINFYLFRVKNVTGYASVPRTERSEQVQNTWLISQTHKIQPFCTIGCSELRLAFRSKVQVRAAELELPPQSGVDFRDGRGQVLMVGPGHGPRNHHPLPLVGDNEYSLIERQSLRQQPGTQGDA